MILRTLMAVVAAALLTMSPDVSVAQPVSTYPGLSVAFRDRTGAGSTTQSFDVWMRIVNSGPDDFNFNGSSPNTQFGLPLLSLPAAGRNSNGDLLSFVGYTQAFIAPFWDCTGNFVSPDCGGAGPYAFTFNSGANSLYAVTNLSVAKNGGFYDYLLGTLSPNGGSVLPDTYRFFNSGFFVGVEGVDAAGVVLSATISFDLVAACANGNDHPDCNFVRTVGGSDKSLDTVAPEPATVLMLGGGFVALALVRLRRRRNGKRCILPANS